MDLKYYNIVMKWINSILSYDTVIIFCIVLFLCALGTTFLIILYYYWLFNAIKPSFFMGESIYGN